MIDFSDIYLSCFKMGLNNQDIIISEIKKLDLDGEFEAVFQDGVLIGVKY